VSAVPFDDGVTIDARGRELSGRDFRRLADEHASVTARLRAGLEAGCGDEEIAGQCAKLVQNLLNGHEEVGSGLGLAGDGQVVMARRNVAAEDADIRNSVDLQGLL
jgi:hypothetical protein